MTQTVGFIGTGTMGAHMSEHLLDAGYQMNIFNRTKDKAQSLIAKGAKWCDSAMNVAELSDVIFSMVGYPNEVEEVYYGERGIFQSAIDGKYIIDLSTNSPTLAKKIFQSAKDSGAFALDAPVIGTKKLAKNSQVTIVVGGEEEIFEKVKPLLDLMGNQVVFQGEAGAGQNYKLSRQVMVAGMMMGIFESLAYAEKSGLDLTNVVNTMKAIQRENLDFMDDILKELNQNKQSDFSMKYFIKDLKIVLEESKHLNVPVPSTELVERLYEQLKKEGLNTESPQEFMQLWWS